MSREDHEITLRLLNEIEQRQDVSQRVLSKRLGIAVGLTNAYLRRCIRKGLVKVSEAPPRRYLYYLTPQGFLEKSRLTARYLERSFQFFRDARRECMTILADCRGQGRSRIVLYGQGELTEIAGLAAREAGVQLVGVVAPGCPYPELHGLPVLPEIPGHPDWDAVLVTDINDPQGAYDRLVERLPDDRILVPGLLMVNRHGGAPAGAPGGTDPGMDRSDP